MESIQSGKHTFISPNKRVIVKKSIKK